MRKNRGIFDTLIGLGLMCVFAACMLLALASGAGIYKDISSSLERQYGESTALAYVSARIRAADETGAVALGALDGTPALELWERDEDGEEYVTCIYWYDGGLYELYFLAGDEFLPSDGDRLMDVESLRFTLEGGLVRIECGSGEQTLYLRGGAL